jgi:hypothetical protein
MGALALDLPTQVPLRTLTPAVQVTTTDPDGDNPVPWYAYGIVDSHSTTLWSQWFNSTAVIGADDRIWRSENNGSSWQAITPSSR